MKLYFYCIMRNYRPRWMRLRGLDDAKVVSIRSDDLQAAVSHTRFRSFPDTPENREKHACVIDSIARKTPVAPFKFNTIVGETVGRGILCEYYDDLSGLIDALGGRREFTVYVNRDIGGRLRALHVKAQKGGKEENRPYNKMTDIPGHRLAGRIHKSFDSIAERSTYERMISGERIMEGHYLVADRDVPVFEQTVKWVESLYPGLYIIVAGPQPPWYFNDIDIRRMNTRLYGDDI